MASLETYVNNRDTTIIPELIRKNYNLTRDTIKKAYISLINGGKSEYYKIKRKTQHIQQFNEEISTIHEQLKRIYPIPWNYSKQKPKKKNHKKNKNKNKNKK